MKIEKISENQIKCTLNRSDLASRQLKISELAYGTEKTRDLFQDMMTQAENEVGFEAKDLPLMIEAIPVSMDCVVLMITKVEDPDEMDQKFSDFTRFESGKDSGSDDLSYLLDDKSFKGLLDEVDATINDRVKPEAAPASGYQTMEKIFSFDSLDNVIDFAHRINSFYQGENSLFKNRENGRYYLLMNRSKHTIKEFGITCNSALEYGRKEPLGYARSAFLKEHYDLMLDSDAIQTLANV